MQTNAGWNKQTKDSPKHQWLKLHPYRTHFYIYTIYYTVCTLNEYKKIDKFSFIFFCSVKRNMKIKIEKQITERRETHNVCVYKWYTYIFIELKKKNKKKKIEKKSKPKENVLFLFSWLCNVILLYWKYLSENPKCHILGVCVMYEYVYKDNSCCILYIYVYYIQQMTFIVFCFTQFHFKNFSLR